jgi:hypothetical protein
VLEQNRIKPADDAMDNSVSNIQLTPEAKRIIEGEIAYQTSGPGFWIGVVIIYVVSIVSAIVFILGTYAAVFNHDKPEWFGLLFGLWLLIPAWFISSINRAIKNRKGSVHHQ